MITASQLAQSLRDRGVVLEPPADEPTITRAQRALDLTFADEVLHLYRGFNGFAPGSMDPRTGIAIWNLDRIISREVPAHRAELAFADVLIDSEFLVADLGINSSAVLKYYEDTVLSASFGEFLNNLITGDFR